MTTKSSLPPSTPAAIRQLELALEHVENAQRLLSKAMQELCSIRRGSDLHRKTGKLYDRTRAHWYVVQKAAESRKGMSHDREDE